MNSVSLWYSDRLSTSELRIMKIIEFMGGSVEARDISHLNDEVLAVSGTECVIVSAATLANLRDKTGEVLSTLRSTDVRAKIFVYGFEDLRGNAELLQEISAGAFADVELSPASNEQVRLASDDIWKQMSG